MDGRNENKLPGLLFLGMWWMIDANTPYGDSAFLLALALLLIAWLSIRFFSVARTRLGEHAWAVLAQAVALAIAIFLIYPGPATMVLFWVWALGPFLIFAAAALRIALHGQGFQRGAGYGPSVANLYWHGGPVWPHRGLERCVLPFGNDVGRGSRAGGGHWLAVWRGIQHSRTLRCAHGGCGLFRQSGHVP